MSEFNEGKKSESHIHKANGSEKALVNEYKADGKFAEQASTDGLERVSVKTGRTIELAAYEFARIDVTVAAHCDKANEEKVYEALVSVVTEIARREEAEVTGRDTDPVPVGIDAVDLLNNVCVARSVSLAYGLTLKGAKRFESHRIDVGRTCQLDDGESIMPVIKQVGDEIGQRIGQHREKIQGGDEKTGL